MILIEISNIAADPKKPRIPKEEVYPIEYSQCLKAVTF